MRPSGLRLTVAALGVWLLLPVGGASAQQGTPPVPPPSAADAKNPAAPTLTPPASASAAPGTPDNPGNSAGAMRTAPATTAPPPSDGAASAPAAGSAAQTPTHPTWTSTDIARVRSMLRAAREGGQTVRAAIQSESPSPNPNPYRPAANVHGDAGAAFAVGFSVDAVVNTSKSYTFFSQHDVTPRFGLWLGHDLVSLQRRLFLGAELGWGVENVDQSGLYGQMLQTSLVTHTFFGAATLRWVLAPWLQPQARLAGGASLVRMEVTSFGERSDADHAASPFGSLGAGVLLRTPTRLFENERGQFASLSFGLLIEGGYAVRGPVNLALGQSHASRDIPVVNAKLGELSLSGAYVRTSLVARF